MRRMLIVLILLACAVVAQDAPQQELTPRVALDVVGKAARSYRGTLDEHALIQASLAKLAAVLDVYEAEASVE